MKQIRYFGKSFGKVTQNKSPEVERLLSEALNEIYDTYPDLSDTVILDDKICFSLKTRGFHLTLSS